MTIEQAEDTMTSTRCHVCDAWKGTVYPVCMCCWRELPLRLRQELYLSPADPATMWRTEVYLGLRGTAYTHWYCQTVTPNGVHGTRVVRLDPRLASQVVVGGTAAEYGWCSVSLGGAFA